MIFKKLLLAILVFFSGFLLAFLVETLKRKSSSSTSDIYYNSTNQNNQHKAANNNKNLLPPEDSFSEKSNVCNDYVMPERLNIDDILKEAENIGKTLKNIKSDLANDVDFADDAACNISSQSFIEIEFCPEQTDFMSKSEKNDLIDEILMETEPAATKIDVYDNLDIYYHRNFLELMNNYRSDNNLPKLKLSLNLCRAAQIRSQDLAESFSEKRPNGNDFSDVFHFVNHLCNESCENIAYGRNGLFTVSQVFEQWLEQPQYNKNILNEKMKKVGISYKNVKTDKNNYSYWVADFTD